MRSWEEKLTKESNKLKIKEEELKLKEKELKIKEEQQKVENKRLIKKDEDLVELLCAIDIDKEIPDSMYKAVSEIFSFIYDLTTLEQKKAEFTSEHS